MGKLLVDAGYHVCFGDAAGMEPAQTAADRAGAVADTPYNDAAVCDVVIFAADRTQMDDLIAQSGSIAPHAVVIDAMESARSGDENGAALLARKLDTHRVVRAMIPLPQAGANVLFCSDDADAMTVAEEVFRTAGCVTTDRGPLANAAEIETSAENSVITRDSSFATLKSVNTAQSQ